MSNKLNQLLTDYFKETNPGSLYNERLVEMFRKEICEEILDEHIDEIQREQSRIQNKWECEKIENDIKRKREEAKDIALVAVVIGFFIGFLVNQVTEVAFFLKGSGFNVSWTIVCSIVAISCIVISYQKLYIHKILNAVPKKMNNSGAEIK